MIEELTKLLLVGLKIILIGGGGYCLRLFIEKKVSNIYQKEILEHQNKLEQHTELLKHELYKTAKTAELLIKSQHEIYPLIYEKLVIALGTTQAMQQTGFALGSFQGFSDEEVVKFANDLKIPSQFKNEILAHVPQNLDKAFEKYSEYLPLDLANSALAVIRDGMNEWIKKELYFNTNTNKLIRQIFDNLNRYANAKKLRLNQHYSALPMEDFEKIQEAEALMDKLKEQMLSEMRGDTQGELNAKT